MKKNLLYIKCTEYGINLLTFIFQCYSYLRSIKLEINRDRFFTGIIFLSKCEEMSSCHSFFIRSKGKGLVSY